MIEDSIQPGDLIAWQQYKDNWITAEVLKVDNFGVRARSCDATFTIPGIDLFIPWTELCALYIVERENARQLTEYVQHRIMYAMSKMATRKKQRTIADETTIQKT